MLADIFIILSTIVSIAVKSNDASLTFLRFARFFQVFRILRLDRRRGDIPTMWNVVREHKKELLSSYFVCLNIVLFGSYVVYAVEKTHNQPSEDQIDNMVNGLYWGVITFSSVGYGDFLPKTWAGKILTALFSAFGCAFFSLPAGIIGSGFALHVSRQKRERRNIKIKNPAATLIQAAWRTYAINSNLKGAWNRVLSNIFYEDVLVNDALIHDLNKSRIGEEEFYPFEIEKTLQSCIVSSIQKKKFNEACNVKKTKKQKNSSSVFLEEFLGASCNSANADNFILHKIITRRFEIAVKFIMLMKLFVAINSFKSCNFPYVNVEELLTKSNQQLLESAKQLKEVNGKVDELKVLHCKVDFLLQEMKCLSQEIKQMKEDNIAKKKVTS